MDLPFEPWKISSRELLVRRVGVGDLPALPAMIKQEASNWIRSEQIRHLRDRYVVNFGQASDAALVLIARIAGLCTDPEATLASVLAPGRVTRLPDEGGQQQ